MQCGILLKKMVSHPKEPKNESLEGYPWKHWKQSRPAGAIAGRNISLAARALGVGAIWLGTWFQLERVEAQQLFFLSETAIPHSIIALGYPAPKIDPAAPRESRYEEGRVHGEQW